MENQRKLKEPGPGTYFKGEKRQKKQPKQRMLKHSDYLTLVTANARAVPGPGAYSPKSLSKPRHEYASSPNL